MVPASSIKVSRVSMYSGYCLAGPFFAYGAFTLCGRLSQNLSAKLSGSIVQSEPHDACIMVWPLPLSLAATHGIDVSFSSSGYLDVSVRRVPSAWLWIHHTVTCSACRVSPFRHPRIKAHVQLPAAFRSLPRLSSAYGAKASSLRSY